MIYGYARCSTNEDRQDIDRQKRELKKLGATDHTIYFEYESGLKDDRIEFEKLMNVVNEGDTIIATEVSRLTRSTKMLCDIIERVKVKKLKLMIDSFVVDFTKGEMDPMTEGMLKMWGVFAEIEANLISARVKSGMANAKAKGIKLGRPELTIDNVPAIFLKYYGRLKSGELSISEVARLCNMSRTTVYKYLNLLDLEK